MSALSTAQPATWAHGFDWKKLLRRIRLGRVVPVIGDDLMTVDVDGGRTTLAAELTRLVARDLDVEAYPGDSLRSLATRVGSPDDMRDSLLEVHDQFVPNIVYGPELRKICEIASFPLILTTTTDALLTRALTEHSGVRPLMVDVGPGARYGDLFPDYSRPSESTVRPTVVHLFGDVDRDFKFVLTDEDILEWLWYADRPRKLLDELVDRDLLFIGNRFPDWLTRVFMRSLRRKSLSEDRSFKAIAEDQIRPGSTLGVFLESLGHNLAIYDGDVSSFVDQLHRAWTAQAGHGTSTSVSVAGLLPSQQESADVFISYAREDQDAARRLRERLSTRGLDGWFDDKKIVVGDAYDLKIHNALENCELFVALLSRQTDEADERYFRTEWNLALKRAEKMRYDRNFIIPFIVDDIDHDSLEGIPPGFRQLHIERAFGGDLSDQQLDELTQIIRKIRSRWNQQ